MASRYHSGMTPRPFLALALLVASGCSLADPVTVEDAWIRAAPPGATALAGYATVHNGGRSDVRVRACDSTGFRQAALHETQHGGDGMARMRPLEALLVPAGAVARLQPGGAHLMLIGPSRAFRAGDQVPVCLSVDGVERTVHFEVRAGAPADGAAPAHPGGHH